jgi:ABC-2 type transport system permease protein
MTAGISLVRATLRSRRSVMLWFGLVGAAFAWMMVALYESIANGFDMQSYIDAMPEEMLAAIGMSADSLDEGVFPFADYIAVEFFTWFALALAVWGLIAGAGLIAGEVENGTIDMVLSQPVRRERFLLARFAGVAAVLLTIALACFLGILLGMAMSDADASVAGLFFACLQMALLGLAVAGVGVLLSVGTLSSRRSQMMLVGLVVAEYAMDLVSKIKPDLGWLGKLSVFHYFDPAEIVNSGTPDWLGLGVLVGVAAIGLGAAVWLFGRRDMAR